MSEPNENQSIASDAEALLRCGVVIGGPRSPLNLDCDAAINAQEATPYVLAPEGYRVESLEPLLAAPTRKRGKISLLDTPSFITYIKDQGSENNTKLYADVDYENSYCKIVAVLNDHLHNEEASWRDYTATFAPILSVEWKRWTQFHSKVMSQSAFATFIEENLGDISSTDKTMPTGAEMLEMALAFEATSEKRFKRRIDLQAGGVQLEYVDKADEVTSQKMRMFERFTIGVPVFQGGVCAYPVEARLKFRQQSDTLTFWYELIRADRVFRQAVTDEIAIIAKETGYMLLYGSSGQ